MSSSAFEDSNSFLFGLNHFASPQPSGLHNNNMNANGAGEGGNADRAGTGSLLDGLDAFGGAGGEHGDLLEGGSFTDQLALWTNANFSFDGPTGHALLGDEDKDKDGQDKEGDDADGDHARRVGKRSRNNQGGDNNNDGNNFARNGKNRLRDENVAAPPRQDLSAHDNAGPQAPQLDHRSRSNSQHDGGKQTPNGNAHHNGFNGLNGFGFNTPANNGFQQQQSTPQTPTTGFQTAVPSTQGTVDLSSLLALQQLINQNPMAIASLGAFSGAPQLNALNSQLGGGMAPNANLLQQLQQQLQQQQQQRATSMPGQNGALPNGSLPQANGFHAWSFPGVQGAPQFANAFPQGVQFNQGNAIKSTASSVDDNGSRNSVDEHDGSSHSKSKMSAEERAEILAQRAAERDNIPPLKLINTGNPEADAEANRNAIEEDKRRRNTAASARFRMKKKQREAALESHQKELEDLVAELRGEVEKLRNENTWLKGLIQVRTDGPDGKETSSAKAPSKKKAGLPSSVETLQAAQQLQALQHAMSSQQAAQSQLQAHLQRVNSDSANSNSALERTRDTGIRPRGVGTQDEIIASGSGQKRDRED
jgi:hypothetical protein